MTSIVAEGDPGDGSSGVFLFMHCNRDGKPSSVMESNGDAVDR